MPAFVCTICQERDVSGFLVPVLLKDLSCSFRSLCIVYQSGYLLRHVNQLSVVDGWPCLQQLAFCAVCFAGVSYNREKNESLVCPYQLCYAGCHWLKNVRCLGKLNLIHQDCRNRYPLQQFIQKETPKNTENKATLLY